MASDRPIRLGWCIFLALLCILICHPDGSLSSSSTHSSKGTSRPHAKGADTRAGVLHIKKVAPTVTTQEKPLEPNNKTGAHHKPSVVVLRKNTTHAQKPSLMLRKNITRARKPSVIVHRNSTHSKPRNNQSRKSHQAIPSPVLSRLPPLRLKDSVSKGLEELQSRDTLFNRIFGGVFNMALNGQNKVKNTGSSKSTSSRRQFIVSCCGSQSCMPDFGRRRTTTRPGSRSTTAAAEGGMTEPAYEDQPSEEPTEEPPASEEPVSEEPASEEPASEEPPAEDPAATSEEPPAEETAASEEPLPDETAPEPVPTDPPATAAPTTKPPTAAPTAAPTTKPPTAAATPAPTAAPTAAPTPGPTAAPTPGPTAAPTPGPTAAPTTKPTTPAATAAPTTQAPTTTKAACSLGTCPAATCTIDKTKVDDTNKILISNPMEGVAATAPNGRQYFIGGVMMGSKSFSDAATFCCSLRMSLVVFKTQAEGDALALQNKNGMMPAERVLWTGGTDEGCEGKFAWCGKPPSALQGFAWQAGQPDNAGGAENCAAVVLAMDGTAKLKDMPCSTPQGYICEGDPPAAAATAAPTTTTTGCPMATCSKVTCTIDNTKVDANNKILITNMMEGVAASTGGRQYLIGGVMMGQKSYSEAAAYCCSLRMGLVDLNTQAEGDALAAQNAKGMMPAERVLWTSGNDIGCTGKYGWCALTPSALTGFAWQTGQPDGSGGAENCAAVVLAMDSTAKLKSLPCSTKLGYICEGPPPT